jgi:hypothetical protein
MVTLGPESFLVIKLVFETLRGEPESITTFNEEPDDHAVKMGEAS